MINQPYLIQRGKCIIDRYNGPADQMDLTALINFDYMGSSEFEFGTLYESLQKIFAQAERIKEHKFSNLLDRNGAPLLLYGQFSDKNESDQYGEYIIQANRNPKLIKSNLFMDRSMTLITKDSMSDFDKKRKKNLRMDYDQYLEYVNSISIDVWLDIDNCVFFSFRQDFMSALPNAIEISRQKIKRKSNEIDTMSHQNHDTIDVPSP